MLYWYESTNTDTEGPAQRAGRPTKPKKDKETGKENNRAFVERAMQAAPNTLRYEYLKLRIPYATNTRLLLIPSGAATNTLKGCY